MVEAASRRGATVLPDVEKATGLRYNEHGLLWDKYLRQYYNAFQGTYHDAMHMLAANGGVGPHQITGFLFALQDADITLKALDEFQTQVRKGPQRLLRRNFFQQRPVRERHSAFKCFAAECVAAVDVLVMFSRCACSQRVFSCSMECACSYSRALWTLFPWRQSLEAR